MYYIYSTIINFNVIKPLLHTIMTKFLVILFFTITSLTKVYAQETNLPTKFVESGSLYKNLDDSSSILAEFKKNDECFVLAYLGKSNYRIKYKDLIGYVDSDDLIITEEITDLFYDYQEKERLKSIEEAEKRKQKIQQIVKGNQEPVNVNLKQDSIAKVEKIEALEIARKNQEIINQKRKQDSISKAFEENKRIELLALERKNKELINEKRKLDSIAKVAEAEKIKAQDTARKNQEIINQKRKQDSISKAIEENKRIELLALERKNKELINQKRKLDSIAKVAEAEKIKAQEIAKKTQEILNQKLRQDSINNVSEQNKKNELIELEKKNKADSNTNASNIKPINTCKYLINEYDEFYKAMNIRTDAYLVNKNLTIELYKYKQEKQVFFNLSEKLGCASYLPGNRSYVKITLENNDLITFYHSWNIDCENFSLKARLSESQIIKLKKSPIKSIRLQGTKDYLEITNPDYKTFFIDKLKCIE
jgi:hypothetical protein